MSEELKVFTKYSKNNKEKSSRYLWVFAEEDDFYLNHPPVLDWQSGLENLKQLQIEPIEKKNNIKQVKCPCQCDESIKNNIENVKKTLKNLLIDDIPEMLDQFLNSEEPESLLIAIKESENKDPVSSYQLRKIAKKLKII